jgi:hypothetical protein
MTKVIGNFCNVLFINDNNHPNKNNYVTIHLQQFGIFSERLLITN